MRLAQVLVVDDDMQMQFFLKEVLQRQSYGVTATGSAEGALEALRADRFDVVLLDLQLPRMLGLEALDEILKIDRSTPIIIMTAHGTQETAVDAMRRGAYDYVIKPFRIEEMEIVIRRALEKRRLLAEIDRLRAELSGLPAVRSSALGPLPLDQRIDHLERGFVLEALARTGGVQAAAARLLGVSERSIWHLVKKHRIEVEKIKGQAVDS